jgi:hypothetical protein
MSRILIFILFITLLSSCTLYSRIQKDDSGDYVTRKGIRYPYYRIDRKNGYIFDDKGKKIVLSTLDSIGPIKFFK